MLVEKTPFWMEGEQRKQGSDLNDRAVWVSKRRLKMWMAVKPPDEGKEK